MSAKNRCYDFDDIFHVLRPEMFVEIMEEYIMFSLNPDSVIFIIPCTFSLISPKNLYIPPSNSDVVKSK